MSFVMMVFMAVPILAPAAGEGIMHLSAWRAIFLVLLVASLVTLAWSQWRLPETMSEAGNLPFSATAFAGSIRLAVTTRQTLGYTVALGCMFGILMSYVASSEQIFVDVYQLGSAFPLVFGAIASVMIAASFINSQIVERYGMHRVSHIALAGFLGVCALMALAGYPKEPPLPVFALFIASAFFCFGLIAPNFNALAMEPMGKIAGTASSLLGCFTTASAAIFGWLIGQSFDNSVRPLCIGFSLLAVAALVVVLITERFRFAVSQPDGLAR
jgi:DHA1 family bicyclomycin/chloramphenicol resistance-like MFS transporter